MLWSGASVTPGRVQATTRPSTSQVALGSGVVKTISWGKGRNTVTGPLTSTVETLVTFTKNAIVPPTALPSPTTRIVGLRLAMPAVKGEVLLLFDGLGSG